MRISNCLPDSRRVAKACGNIRSLTNQTACDSPLDFPGQIKETRMTEAFVFEALRTPRGKDKKDGSLYEVKPVTLLSGLLRELQACHDFDTAEVEDVVMLWWTTGFVTASIGSRRTCARRAPASPKEKLVWACRTRKSGGAPGRSLLLPDSPHWSRRELHRCRRRHPESALVPPAAGHQEQIKQGASRSSPIHAVLRALPLKIVVYQGFQGGLGLKYKDAREKGREHAKPCARL